MKTHHTSATVRERGETRQLVAGELPRDGVQLGGRALAWHAGTLAALGAALEICV